MDAAEYKHVVLGLIFLKYISDAFEAKHAELRRSRRAPTPKTRRVPRREHLLGAEGGALVPPQGKRQAADDRQAGRRRDGGDRARQPVAEGRAAQGLRPPGLDKQRLGSSSTWSATSPRRQGDRSKDTLGRVYEYFLSSSPAPRARRAASSTRPVARGAGAGRDARAVQGPRLRPVLRLGRHVRAEREVHRGPRRQASATSRSTARSQLHDLAPGQDEPRDPRHRRADRARRHLPQRRHRTSRPTTCWPTRRSTTATGAATAC
jgi:hypothetical protein